MVKVELYVPGIKGKEMVEIAHGEIVEGSRGKRHRLYGTYTDPETKKIHKAALPYLKRDVGGDGWETVGEKVLHAKEYDGIVHLAPFTCTPEIVAQNIMPSTKENIPVLTILCDEQLAKAGVLTRLEAFVDLLERKRWVNNKQQRVVV